MQKVIIVGFGFMGVMHAQVYQRLPQVRIAAVVNDNVERARAELARLGIDAPVFAELDEAFAAQAADFVDICLRTDLHAPFALKAITAGKHLFCEKPLALNLEDASTIIGCAEKAGVFAQVGQCIRFWPEYVALQKFVAAGTAGKLLSLSLQRRAGRPGYSSSNWLNEGGKSGGAALDLHIHDTDFVHHLLGRPASVTSRATFDFSGCSHIFTSYEIDGVVVTAEGGWNYPANWGFQMAFQAVFENAAIEYDSRAEPPLMVTLGDARPEPLAFDQPDAGESAVAIGNVSSLGGYFNELQYFVDCLERCSAPDRATLRQAAESLETVLAEVESARTGRRMPLPATAFA
jgi:predicted dehydrogenase